MCPQVKNRVLSPEKRCWRGDKKNNHRKKGPVWGHSKLVSIIAGARVFTLSYFLQTLLPPENFVSTSVPRDVGWSEARNVLIRKTCVCAQSLSGIQYFCNPMDYSLLGSSVHGIFQARIPEWVAVYFSSRSFWFRDQTRVSCTSYIGRRILYHWAPWEAPIRKKVVLKSIREITSPLGSSSGPG